MNSNIARRNLGVDVATDTAFLDGLAVELAADLLLPNEPHEDLGFVVGEAAAFFDAGLDRGGPRAVGFETTCGLSLVVRLADGLGLLPGDLCVLLSTAWGVALPPDVDSVCGVPASDAVLHGRLVVVTAETVLAHERVVVPTETEGGAWPEFYGHPLPVPKDEQVDDGLDLVQEALLDLVTTPKAA